MTTQKLKANAAWAVTSGETLVQAGTPSAIAFAVLEVPAGVPTADHRVMLNGQFQVDCPTATCGVDEFVGFTWALHRDEVQIGPVYDAVVSNVDLSDFLASINLIDTVAAGPHNYELVVTVETADEAVTVSKVVLNAVDLGRA